jgi:hypothetical protein
MNPMTTYPRTIHNDKDSDCQLDQKQYENKTEIDAE